MNNTILELSLVKVSSVMSIKSHLNFNLLLILLALFISCSQPLSATENHSWLPSIDNFRYAIDISVRPQLELRQDDYSHIESIGLDTHKVFTSKNGGDIATLIVQGYFTKLNDITMHPPFYNGPNDVKFICRICNLNVTVLDQGKLNLRMGHAEIPFGLEYNQDTNGTLRQYSNGRDLGNKLDWGLAANGKLAWGGYELSLSQGAGVDWKSDRQSYIVSGRVEKTNSYSSIIGLSAFYGHLRSPASSADFINRSRIGLDGSQQWRNMTFLAEASAGKDDDTKRFMLLLEADIHSANEKWLTYLQLKNTSLKATHHSWDSVRQSSLGMRFTVNNAWTLSGQWTHDLTVFNNAEKKSMLELQARFRF